VSAEAEQPAAPQGGMMRFRRSKAPRLDPDKARRQGDITRLAFLVLGREGAMDFLNSANAGLGGRPLDLAIASAEGRDLVEAALGRMTYTQPA
jgi:uncharacterized protein (DUF2384 family)